MAALEASRVEEAMELSTLPVEGEQREPVKIPDVIEKDEEAEKERGPTADSGFACIISKTACPALEEALKHTGLEVCYSQDGRHLPDHVPDECDIVFVLEEFSGPVFDQLRSAGMRIVGTPCVYACGKRKKPLPNSVRPVYSCTMEGCVVCFTGFKDKEELHNLCNRVHMMGGSIRKDMTSSVTHVVAHTVSGSKYKVAVGLETPIMSEEWVMKAWDARNDIDVSSNSEELMQYKQFPFAGCTIAFLGFTEEEEDHMKDIAAETGAEVKSLGSSGVSHLVVANELDPADIPVVSSRVTVVKVQWFWESIQIDACADEMLYLAKDAPSKKKRKRLSTALNSSTDRFSDASLFSIASSTCSLNTPTKTEGHPTSSAACSSPSPVDTARHHITSELLQTEKNFVSILRIIVEVFKQPLENPSMRGGPILAAEDIKGIFANVDDILHVHERIMSNLASRVSSWTDDTCIGTVLLDEADELVHVYPPFINYFEISKESLNRCDKQYPRFHAFLRANESRPECARQSLEDLLITPVQRLPRIILLLQDLIKHTDPGHEDYNNLQKALECLKKVMTHINEDKRKTEGQVHMFEVLRDIENCPAIVLSANRSFLAKFDVVDVASPKTAKGDQLVLYLFSDSIEIAKRKSTTTFTRSTKPLRHLEFFSLMHFRAVVSFPDTPDMFGFLVRWPSDPEHEKLLAFRLVSSETTAADLTDQLCKQLASLNYVTDHEHLLVTASSDTLLSISSNRPGASSSTLKRALSGAKKKVQRALSGKSQRKPLVSLHLNLQSLDESQSCPPVTSPTSSVLEPPDSPGNQSIMSSQSMCMFTSVTDLRTPQPKRAAVTRSFGAADKKGYLAM